jgi:sugar lactone lactonase YvrE
MKEISGSVVFSIFIHLLAVIALAHPPTGIAVDREGNVYLVDVVSNIVFKITPESKVEIVAGSGEVGHADGASKQAKFTYPHSLTMDAKGNLYVGEYDGHRVRKITPDGNVTTLAGSGEERFAEGVGAEAKLERPAALAVDGEGNVYVAHDRAAVVSKITPDGKVSKVGSVDSPRGIAVDGAGNLYVSTGDQTILKITANGETTILASGLANVWGVAVDKQGTVYVADLAFGVRKITADGIITALGGITSGASGVAVDQAGNVYVLDDWEGPPTPPKVRVRKVSPRGSVITLVGARK